MKFLGLLVVLAFTAGLTHAQGMGHPTPPPPPPGAKSPKCANRPIPQFEDVTAKSGIAFSHASTESSNSNLGSRFRPDPTRRVQLTALTYGSALGTRSNQSAVRRTGWHGGLHAGSSCPPLSRALDEAIYGRRASPTPPGEAQKAPHGPT